MEYINYISVLVIFQLPSCILKKGGVSERIAPKSKLFQQEIHVAAPSNEVKKNR